MCFIYECYVFLAVDILTVDILTYVAKIVDILTVDILTVDILTGYHSIVIVFAGLVAYIPTDGPHFLTNAFDACEIDEDGIIIDSSQVQMQNFYTWSDLESYQWIMNFQGDGAFYFEVITGFLYYLQIV